MTELRADRTATPAERSVSPASGTGAAGAGPVSAPLPDRVGPDRVPPNLVHVFPSFAIGGVPLRIAAIINRLGDRYRHTVIALDGRFDSGGQLDPARRVGFGGFNRPGRGGVPATLLAIARHLNDLRPDLLLTYNWGAIDWAMANTLRPVCRHIHFESGFGPEEADRQIRRRVLWRRLALRRVERLVVPSHTLHDIASRVWKIPARKVRLIANGVDRDRFRGTPGMVEPGPFPRLDGEAVIGTVAPLRAEKALDRMIRAFASVAARRPARLVIVGDGPERPRLADLARDLGIADRVVFPGHVDAVERAYRWFDVFTMSSDTEQMPNVLIQAMAAGRPVVATDVGDIRRIVADENVPFIVAKSDEGGYAEALLGVSGDRDLAAVLGHANQARVAERYDLDRMVADYAAVFAGTTVDR